MIAFRFFIINWRFSEIIRFMRLNRCLDWRRKRWSIGLTFSIGEWYFFDSILNYIRSFELWCSSWSSVFYLYHWNWSSMWHCLLLLNQIIFEVIAGSSITLWTLEWINLCLPVYLIFHLCFTITGLRIHVLTSASRRGTPEFSMYFFIVLYVSLNCCYICIFPSLVLAFVYVKYIRSVLYMLL